MIKEVVMARDLLNIVKSDLGSWLKNKRDWDSVMEDMLTGIYSSFPISQNFPRTSYPKADFSASDKAYLLELELPGIEQKDVEIKLEGNILTVTGKKEEKSETKEENYYTRERFYGSFRRAFTLPANVIDKDITAAFKDGVLTITVPKKEQEFAKKIKIKGD
jgi:HSP20 family protein